MAILKHTNPCGVGSDPDLREAWLKAFATDKQAPFGGIIICNRPLDLPVAKAIGEIFSEVIIAPEFRLTISRKSMFVPSAVGCWCSKKMRPNWRASKQKS